MSDAPYSRWTLDAVRQKVWQLWNTADREMTYRMDNEERIRELERRIAHLEIYVHETRAKRRWFWQ